MKNVTKSIVSLGVNLAIVGIAAGVNYIQNLNDRVKDIEVDRELESLRCRSQYLSYDEIIKGSTNKNNHYLIRQFYTDELNRRHKLFESNIKHTERLANELDILEKEIKDIKNNKSE